ncbi:uncharacterized protein CBL_10177 [Carabus blaptoides fortunei]
MAGVVPSKNRSTGRKQWTLHDGPRGSLRRLRSQLASDGCPESQVVLAKQLLEEECELEIDKKENARLGVYWLIKASEQGNSEATELLNKCLITGRGITEHNYLDVKSCINMTQDEKIARKAAREMFASLSNGEDFITSEQLQKRMIEIRNESLNHKIIPEEENHHHNELGNGELVNNIDTDSDTSEETDWSTRNDTKNEKLTEDHLVTAAVNYSHGGIFLLLGVPKGTEFGIDMKVWNTDENFRGIKMIPPGLHFIHFSAVNNTGQSAPRSGFFYNFKKSDFVVKLYDKKTEDISTEPISESEITRLKDNLVQLDKFLGPYPYDILEKWNTLTNYLSDQLAVTLSPNSGLVRSELTLMPCSDADRPRASAKTTDEAGPSTSSANSTSTNLKSPKRSRCSDGQSFGEDLLPNLKPVEGTEIRFTKFPENKYPDGSTPAQITKHSLDSTYVLDTMLKRHKSVVDFIGELQFAFVCFLVGHCLDAFEHWKSMVGLLCSCDEALIKYRGLYDMFITVLEPQLQEIPEEFLADIVANNNFVYCKLKTLFSTIQETEVESRLKMKIIRFRDSLSEKYSWNFGHSDEDDEDAPVVVDL